MTSEAQAHADISQAVQSRQRMQIGLAFFSFILIGANDGGLGVLLPSISAYYGISKGTAGLIFPAATSSSYIKVSVKNYMYCPMKQLCIPAMEILLP